MKVLSLILGIIAAASSPSVSEERGALPQENMPPAPETVREAQREEAQQVPGIEQEEMSGRGPIAYVIIREARHGKGMPENEESRAEREHAPMHRSARREEAPRAARPFVKHPRAVSARSGRYVVIVVLPGQAAGNGSPVLPDQTAGNGSGSDSDFMVIPAPDGEAAVHPNE